MPFRRGQGSPRFLRHLPAYWRAAGGIWLLEELVSGLQAGAKRGGLFLAGVVMAAAIALHNLPEGMVIGASYAADLAEAGQDGRMMALVIGLHNIPEGMAVAVPLAAGVPAEDGQS